MSHEITTRPLPLVNPELDYELYYGVPLLDRTEWNGIEYDSIQYSWNELDYRFSVEYPLVPEPADAGFVGGILAAIFVAFCYFKNKKDMEEK
jgi:hypothetical protein